MLPLLSFSNLSTPKITIFLRIAIFTFQFKMNTDYGVNKKSKG